METRHGMPVWSPTDLEMNEIRRRVSRERALAARDLYRAVREIFRSHREAKQSEPADLKVVNCN